MRLDHLKLRGFMTAFAGKDVTIDFASLPPGLIAFVGDNGAGKTTLMEAGPAGLYRQLMSREHELVDYAQDRDSSIEARWTFDGGVSYRARLQADGIKRSTTAVLMREGQHKPLNDGKVTHFREYVDTATVTRAHAASSSGRAYRFHQSPIISACFSRLPRARRCRRFRRCASMAQVSVASRFSV